MPRSGSTPVSLLLGNYFQQHFDATNLMEFFHAGLPLPKLQSESWEAKALIADPSLIGNASQFPGAIQEVRSKKLRLLLTSKRQFVLKIFPMQLDEDSVISLRQKFRIIALERDLWKTFVSYCISRATGLWYKEQALEIPDQSVYVEQAFVQDFFESYFSFEMMKRRLKLETIQFEDFEQFGASYILKKLSYEAPIDISAVHLTVVQNGLKREARIANIDQVRVLFSETLQSTNRILDEVKY